MGLKVGIIGVRGRVGGFRLKVSGWEMVFGVSVLRIRVLGFFNGCLAFATKVGWGRKETSDF